jgi:hypothetical protein
MYDLMRKSIAATHKLANKRRPSAGQHHLLYKNGSKAHHTHHTQQQQQTLPSNNASPSSNVVPSMPCKEANNLVLYCPTRLLIRRRSLRVVEEGGGTHIYAIRYPEDTANEIVSEQAAHLPLPSRQEQCPPRKQSQQQQQQQHTASTTAATSASSSSGAGGSTRKTTSSSSQTPMLPMPVIDGDVFTTAAMASKPRQPGE